MKKTILIFGMAAFVGLIVHPVEAQSRTEKEAAVLKYKGKFLIVKNDGISVGLAGEGMCSLGDSSGAINVLSAAGGIEVRDRFHCCTEPIHKGECLKIRSVRLGKDYLDLAVQSITPHSITRGIGAFAHPSMEQGRAYIVMDFDTSDALVAQRFTLLDGTDSVDGAQLGNTAAGVFVNQVKAGMSFAEVESALGVPQTRIDLGEKVLYKYKDMTVEFHDGKVADVR